MANKGMQGVQRPRQGKASIQLIAAAIGVLPLYLGSIVYQLGRQQPLSIRGFIFYLAVISPLAVVIAFLLLRFLCREDYRKLNLKPASVSSDLLAALVLCPVILLANIGSNLVLSEVLPTSASNTGIKHLFLEVAKDPRLLALFLGPLIFLGAASEELIRVFLLSRLWKAWPSSVGKSIAVIISALLFGFVHVYRGPAHVGWASIFGLIMALYYLRFGRVVPLILAHYVTNAIQVVVAVAQAR